MNADVRPRPVRSTGRFAIGLGVVALLSCWSGWGGIGLGVVGVAVAVAVARQPVDRRAAAIAAALGLVATVVGVAVVAEPFGGPGFGSGLTLDQCMEQAGTAKLQHLCKTQHLDEFMQRYPHADE